ncbi:extracellular solute-binding protein family 5 [Beutenbergia cavernae DSM 12333]|uniref:Extracellular solute-binding protein family 5 n=1 Tax=Beutenbergia cavernae (strain ATCC BAA-8 / DSM 12333 / CCUG 43141 / JCM 11478 / NBRC 16432 / NCIMB 13614 / HKI 0122) TaxID=471853 RepID=C5C4S5_BEUC1|nr:ABC transporter substrate-binding protein [Beutenbergia cavernae]ACQ80053.1 extracellular solute-binding protein family 5 [Beutenbergia cavernae DSM 12333]
MVSSRSRVARHATILLSALLLAACAGGDPGGGEQSGTEAEPEPGGRLTVALNGDEPDNLDPHGLSATNTTVLLRPVLESLFWQAEDGTFHPWLADSWEVSDDGLVYTFALREGVTFHDGAAWDAEALLANFEHILDPETQSPLAAAYIAPYSSARVVDELTLEVTLSTPYSAFINVLSQSYLSIVSPQQIAEDPAGIREHPVGTGPFIFDHWTQGESISYRQNPDYDWAPEAAAQHEGPAYVDELEILFIPEEGVRYNALAAGDVDVIDWTPPQNVEAVEASADLDFARVDRPGHPFSIWFNTSRAPLDDVRVRQAVVAAVDRQSIVDTVSFGQWQLADGYLTSPTPDFAPNSDASITYDVERANELLDEAGWTERDAEGYRTRDGERLSLFYPTAGTIAQTQQILELAQAHLKEVGVEVVIQTVSEQEQSERSSAGDFDLSAGIWTTNTADVLYIQYNSHNITTPERRGNNSTRLRDEQIDDLTQRAREATDDATRQELYSEAQARLVELAPSLPLYTRPSLVSSSSSVHGIGFDYAYGALWFYDTWKES